MSATRTVSATWTASSTRTVSATEDLVRALDRALAAGSDNELLALCREAQERLATLVLADPGEDLARLRRRLDQLGFVLRSLDL